MNAGLDTRMLTGLSISNNEEWENPLNVKLISRKVRTIGARSPVGSATDQCNREV